MIWIDTFAYLSKTKVSHVKWIHKVGQIKCDYLGNISKGSTCWDDLDWCICSNHFFFPCRLVYRYLLRRRRFHQKQHLFSFSPFVVATKKRRWKYWLVLFTIRNHIKNGSLCQISHLIIWYLPQQIDVQSLVVFLAYSTLPYFVLFFLPHLADHNLTAI